MLDVIAGNKELVRKLLGDGLVALVLKVSSAAFSYIMFVAIGRLIGVEAFGVFGAAFSLALILGKIGLAGQELLMVRVVPRYDQRETESLQNGAVRFGLGVTLLLSTAVGAALAVYTVGFIPHEEAMFKALLAASLLVPVLAMADVHSGVQRGGGSVVSALAPRDVIWRGLVSIGALLIPVYWPMQLGASQVLMACTICLAVIVLAQSFGHPLTRMTRVLAKPASYETREWGRTAFPFWISSVVMVTAPNLAVVVLAAVLAAEQTGPFFAAVKTAQLMSLLLLASEIVSAPLISRHFARQEHDKVQLICTVISLVAFCFALAAFVFMIFAGGFLLNFFGPGFDSVQTELLIISGGFMVHAACGPNNILLNMSAHGSKAMQIMFVVNAAGLVLLPVMTVFGGSLGAAAAIALITSAWNIWMVIYSLRRIKIDPSVFGVIRYF